MKKTLLLLSALLALHISACALERKQLIDHNWQFSLNEAQGEWQTVDLPHDWSNHLPISKDAPGGNDNGYRQTGVGCYRKTLQLDKAYEGKRIQLYFEGVYMNSKVYVNDSLAGGHPYGYSSFFVDITPYVRTGTNEVRVTVDNARQKNCRWYTGSGIYRHVWLVTTEMVHIANWGVAFRAVENGKMTMEVKVRNDDHADHAVSLSGQAPVLVKAGTDCILTKDIDVSNKQRWSPEHPTLYKEQIALTENGHILDQMEQTYGVRTLEWSAEKGLLLNGERVKLNGACVHHDHGMLGAASHDAAERRKVRLLKEAGFNAVRTSHNPPAEAFLTACDELGLLVIDEAFDGWREQKLPYDYHTLIDQWWAADIDAMALRDRNHPSIFCWSTGNEVIERKKIEVVHTAHKMATRLRQLGDGRPVTSALAAWDKDWDIYDPLAAEHDIVGYNYMMHKAESDHERVPGRVMMQTESYPRDAWANYERAMRLDYVLGDFVWTGIDYIGESGIGRYYYEGETPGESWERPLFPWNGAYCGDIDLTGQRKPISHYRAMLWHPTEPIYMAVREPDGYHGKIKETMWSVWPTWESWSWPGWEGKNITVEVYTREPSVRLYLNGQLVGEQKTDKMMASFTLPYAAGTLRAEAGAHQTTLATAGKPAALRLKTEDSGEMSFVLVEIVDAKGRLCPEADALLHFSLKGKGRLVAVGNADLKDTSSRTGNERRAWKGRALAATLGTGRLTVTAQGLKSASTVVGK